MNAIEKFPGPCPLLLKWNLNPSISFVRPYRQVAELSNRLGRLTPGESETEILAELIVILLTKDLVAMIE
jgi:hypothetical protein